MSHLKFIVLFADSRFPLGSYLLSFTLLGIEKDKLCGEALIYYLYPKVPLHAFKPVFAISSFQIWLVPMPMKQYKARADPKCLLGPRHSVYKPRDGPTRQAISLILKTMTLKSEI